MTDDHANDLETRAVAAGSETYDAELKAGSAQSEALAQALLVAYRRGFDNGVAVRAGS